jgi:glycosyltransferase involved in cell wall biosynthesis
MDLVVSLEHRYDRTPDGSVWTQTTFAHSYWTRYLAVFDRVRVMARVRDVSACAPGWIRADGEGVEFTALPFYLGPWQYLRRSRQVKRAARAAIGMDDAIILYAPSQIAACIEPSMRRSSRPYGVYVIGDPYEVFTPGSVRHPLRPFFRWIFPRRLRRQCAGACAVAYITEQALQHRYPPPSNNISFSFSMTELPDIAFAPMARVPSSESRTLVLVTVGSLEQLYKAPDVLIDALAACVGEGLDLKLILIGDGKHRAELEARAAALGLSARVCFLGQLPAGDAVRAQLDQADLFVMPSRTEGLPRAMIEAMARGLPCIGSTVGGIPELLPSEDLVPPGDAVALTRKIREVITDRQRMERMASRNLEKASEYHEDILMQRRIAFYRYLRNRTVDWLESGERPELTSLH